MTKKGRKVIRGGHKVEVVEFDKETAKLDREIEEAQGQSIKKGAGAGTELIPVT